MKLYVLAGKNGEAISQCRLCTALRLLDDHTPFITDNGNYIHRLCHFSEIENPAELEKQLIRVPGVVESGLFVGMTEESLPYKIKRFIS
nr:ribose-5-phosphate isomerase A [Priestia megaterium]